MRDLTIRENFQLLMGGNRKRTHGNLKGGDPFSMVTAAIISGAVAYQTKDLILRRVGVEEDFNLNIEQPTAEDIKEYFRVKEVLNEKIDDKYEELIKFAFSRESFLNSDSDFSYPEINSNNTNGVRQSIIKALDEGKSSDSGTHGKKGKECVKTDEGVSREEKPHHPKSIFDYEEILCKLNEYEGVLHHLFVHDQAIIEGGGQKIGAMLDILLNGVQ